MSIPEEPSERGFFKPQEGYANVKVKTHKYLDKPTPLNPSQGVAGDFIATQTDKEHQKDYAKRGGKMLFGFLINFLCH